MTLEGFFIGIANTQLVIDLDKGYIFHVLEDSTAVLLKPTYKTEAERDKIKMQIIGDLKTHKSILPLFCGSVRRGCIVDFDGFTGGWEL
jgi:hypothetical protein